MPQWTPQQNNAITAQGRNILVSAAAGSGKTAVLVERVKRLITSDESPVDIDRLLIVTFTNAAAAEMKYRISKSLKDLIKREPDNKNASRQLSLLPNAQICTIDSFCINLAREYFFELGINRDFTNLDENELSVMIETTAQSLISEYYENKDELFIKLVEMFNSPGNEKPFIDQTKRILRFIYAFPFPFDWCEKSLELYNPATAFCDTQWYKYIHNEIDGYIALYRETAQSLEAALGSINDEKLRDKFLTALKSDVHEIEKYLELYNTSWDSFASAPAPAFARSPSTRGLDDDIKYTYKSKRGIYMDIFKDKIPPLAAFDSEEYKASARELYPLLSKLIEYIKALDSRLYAEKQERNSYSFSDIEHFAIKLLFELAPDGKIKRTPLGDSMTSKYEQILVDEYQDTNEAQDLLFTYLSNGKNLFTVGDVKQSIYRFRLAMPEIFNQRKKSYVSYTDDPASPDPAKIILDRNFRSRRDICSYVNFIFSNCMSERVGELDYGDEDRLNNGAQYNDSAVPSAQLNIIQGVKGEETDKIEAYKIGSLIRHKVESGEPIKDGDSYRPINYGDFAILFRSLKNHAEKYTEVFTKMGIPVMCDNAGNLFDNEEIKIILSYLRTIDNPTQDVPLLATMMSAVYGFTADELAEMKASHGGRSFYVSVLNSQTPKAQAFRQDIANLRELSVTMSVAGFIRYLIESKGIVAISNAMGNGEQRYLNMLELIKFAQNFDRGVNIGLTAFLRYIDKIILSKSAVDSAAPASAADNSVTIMTIHHSKGLEFPVVILAGSSRRYNNRDLSEKLLLNSKLGFGLKLHNERDMYDLSTLPYVVIKNKNAAELMSENLRVLYVAMTRAKEQFIAFAACDNLNKKLEGLSLKLVGGRITPYTVSSLTSDANILILCAMLHKDGKALRDAIGGSYKVCDTDFPLEINIYDPDIPDEEEINITLPPANPDIVEQIKNKLAYHYSGISLAHIPSKMTASSLDDAEGGFEYITASKPAFMNKSDMTPAQRGTAMHAFMQHCDYHGAKYDLQGEVSRLVGEGFITSEQANALDLERLRGFFGSDFAARMFGADKIYKEIKVSSYLTAREVTDVDSDAKILVQGVADCVFEEDGELVLVDYKTDRVSSAEELIDKYRKQISFYEKAISKKLSLPVKSAVLYSFYMQKICIVK